MASQAEREQAVADAQAMLSATQAALAVAQALTVDDETPPQSEPGDYPAWRNGLPLGRWSEIRGTANMGGYAWKPPISRGQNYALDNWIGFAAHGTRWYTACASGHAGDPADNWQNPVLQVDLGADAPGAWGALDGNGSNYAAVTTHARYLDDRPCGRHTYYSTLFLPGKFSDGVDRILLVGCYAAYAIDATGAYPGYDGHNYIGGPETESFRLDTCAWEPAGTWPNTRLYETTNIGSICIDPRDGKIYHAMSYTCEVLDPVARTWALLQGRPGYMDTGMLAMNDQPSLIDVKRNRWIGLSSLDSGGNRAPTQLMWFDLATRTIRFTQLSRIALPASSEGGFVHDLDNDLYLFVQDNHTSATPTPVYAIDPDSGVVSDLGITVPMCQGAPLSKLTYFGDLGGVAYLPRYASNILFLPTRE